MTPSDNSLLNTPASKQWNTIGIRQHHGIALPLFSLHSQLSGGIGEFTDLLPLIDWCKDVNLDIIQLLPLNDTGHDTSPYSAISAFAINPIHLALHTLPDYTNNPILPPIINELRQLNGLQRVAYDKIRPLKERFLDEYFNWKGSQEIESEGYKKFFQDNDWLIVYGLFKTLKSQHNYQHWESWESNLKNPSPEKIQQLLEQNNRQIAYHCFVQYLCFQQLSKVKDYANQRGVLLKGDVPILINRDSADVWGNRELFLMDYSAGAPPDMYSEEGQNWGFPIYNWENLQKTNYKWWRKRLEVACHFYNLYRIDHIVGFFRIWSIHNGQKGNMGHFIPEDPNLWIEHGRKILNMMLESCPMLPIGEDLGFVPPEARICLTELGICGTKVIRWERKWKEDAAYIPFREYNYASMTTVSTHDSETLQQWWTLFPKDAKEYCQFKGWEYTPVLSKEFHQEFLYDSHHTNSLFHINLFQEYLFLVPDMTWPNPEDERINIPGLYSERNWTYRFRPALEDIVSSTLLKKVFSNAFNH